MSPPQRSSLRRTYGPSTTTAAPTELYAYRFDAAEFHPFGDPVHAHVAEREVRPLGPAERVGDVFELFEAADIQLRVLPALLPFWDQVITSTLGFSGIRLRNARAPRIPAP